MCRTHGGLVLVSMPNGPSKMTTCEKPYNSVNANNPYMYSNSGRLSVARRTGIYLSYTPAQSNA